MATTYVPVILSALLTPNPAQAGGGVLVSIAAEDVACVPSTAVYTSGEFTSGEV